MREERKYSVDLLHNLKIDLFPNSTPDGNCGDAVDAQVLTYFMYAAALCFVYSSHLLIMSEFRKRSNGRGIFRKNDVERRSIL
ncbi:hypothetical protein Sarmat_01005 [Rickettsiales endosymbiont of Paramecium tredecaurelia]|nr:hypothetical protein [Candidatus Sarmatiella mevalonica]